LPTTNESHRRVEDEAAATSVGIYRVDFLCPACGEYHGICSHLQFQDDREHTGAVAGLFKGKAIPGAVQIWALQGKVRCPNVAEYVSTSDPTRDFLIPSRDTQKRMGVAQCLD